MKEECKTCIHLDLLVPRLDCLRHQHDIEKFDDKDLDYVLPREVVDCRFW